MKYKFIALFVFIGSLLFEFLAFRIDFNATQELLPMLRFFVFHLISSLLMTYAQILFLPKAYSLQKKSISSLLFLFNFIVPAMGALFSWLLIFWGFVKSQEVESLIKIDDIDMEIISEGFPVVERIFGEGSLSSLLKDKNAPASKKLKALSILTEMKSKESMTLIKETLSDNDDEVRLVGFSIIDNMEKKVNEKIHELKHIILTTRDDIKRATHQKDLAFTYWELIYQGLVDEQLKHYMIENILSEIKAAKKHISEDEKLYKLEGRVFLTQNKFQEAKEAFVKALDLGISEGEVSSFMAEISYQERNYSRIAYWMQKIPKQSLNYQLHSLRSIWQGSVA